MNYESATLRSVLDWAENKSDVQPSAETLAGAAYALIERWQIARKHGFNAIASHELDAAIDVLKAMKDRC